MSIAQAAVDAEPSAVQKQSFYSEQVRQLYSFLPIVLIANAVNSAIVVAVLLRVLPSRPLFFWFAALLLLTGVRVVLKRQYSAADENRTGDRFWGRLFITGAFLSGVLWGVLPIFLFPRDSMPHQVFQAFVIGGMVAAAVSTHSNLRLAFVAYALPAFVPVTVRFYTFSDSLHLAMAVLCSIFIVLMILSAFRNHRTYRAVLELNVVNQSLIRRLSEENVKAERMTEELRNLTTYLEGVREAESKRIASEIHDQLGQSLTAAKMALARLRHSWRDPPENVRTGLQSPSESSLRGDSPTSTSQTTPVLS